MARLTLSEQVNAQATQINTLTAELHTAREAIAAHLRANEMMQAEIARQRTLLNELPNLREELAKVTKERDDAKTSYIYRDKAASKAEDELEQAHAVLDGVEGAPAREYESGGSYGSTRYRNVVTRLAGAFLAIAKNGGAK